MRTLPAFGSLVVLWTAGMSLLVWDASALLHGPAPLSAFDLGRATGNAIVVASAAIHVAHAYLRFAGLARWAERLAVLGAVVLAVSIALEHAGLGRMSYPGVRDFRDHSGLLSMLVVALVAWSRFMSYIARDAWVTAAIMSLAAGAIGWEMHLLGESAGAVAREAVGNHWAFASLVAQAIGYVAVGLGALSGAALLQESGTGAPDTREKVQLHFRHRLIAAWGASVPAFAVAIAFLVGGRLESSHLPEGTLARAACLSALLLLYLHLLARMLRRRPSAPEAARVAVGAFIVTLCGFAGVGLVARVADLRAAGFIAVLLPIRTAAGRAGRGISTRSIASRPRSPGRRRGNSRS